MVFSSKGLRMRYVKNSVVIQAERDIPLLRQLRNSKFASHSQLFELMRFGGSECSRDSFGWRVRRLLKAGFLSICEGAFGAESVIYRITREGVALLEHHGQFTTVLHSRTEHLPHASQVFHSLELNRIQLALATREFACQLAIGDRTCVLQYHLLLTLSKGL